MNLYCRTNLDNTNHEKWPDDLPAAPRVGERIQSKQKWGAFQLELEVVAVTYKWSPYNYWYAEVELHMTATHIRAKWSINDWQVWYDKARRINNGS